MLPVISILVRINNLPQISHDLDQIQKNIPACIYTFNKLLSIWPTEGHSYAALALPAHFQHRFLYSLAAFLCYKGSKYLFLNANMPHLVLVTVFLFHSFGLLSY